jgi:hypothetical protein
MGYCERDAVKASDRAPINKVGSRAGDEDTRTLIPVKTVVAWSSSERRGELSASPVGSSGSQDVGPSTSAEEVVCPSTSKDVAATATPDTVASITPADEISPTSSGDLVIS